MQTQTDPDLPADPAAAEPPIRLGLSGKLLVLTVPLVMIAGLMIYVPAIANFRMNRLNDRLAAANTAALVLDAAPSGLVPDSLSLIGLADDAAVFGLAFKVVSSHIKPEHREAARAMLTRLREQAI